MHSSSCYIIGFSLAGCGYIRRMCEVQNISTAPDSFLVIFSTDYLYFNIQGYRSFRHLIKNVHVALRILLQNIIKKVHTY